VEGGDVNATNYQLYFVEYPSGKTSKITNDLYTYGSTTLTADQKTVATVLNEQEIYLYYVPKGDARSAKKITTLRDDGVHGLAIGEHNEVIYSSRQSGSYDVWSTDLRGEHQKQLTSDEFLERDIAVSTRAGKVVYNSGKVSTPNLWSVNLDGTNTVQLTKDAEDYKPSIDPSGKWVVFDSWLRGPNTIMKVPLAGGERFDVTTTEGSSPCFTNDGKNIVYISFDDRRKMRVLTMVPAEGGKPKALFDLQDEADNVIKMRPRSNDISYIATIEGVSNIYVRSLDGGPARKYTDFNDYMITQFAWTSDGTSLVVSRGDIRSDVVIITDKEGGPAQ
jgi:Tol biopolymer transport system component